MSKKSGRGVTIKDNRVLLIRRNNYGDSYYAIPGGKKEKHESLKETTKRELFEETGITVDVEDKIGKSRGPERSHHLFQCAYLGGNLTPENNSKANKNNTYDPEWLAIEKALEVVVQPECLRKIFDNYLISLN